VNLASQCGVGSFGRAGHCVAVRRLSKKSGETEHVYGEFRYKTKRPGSTSVASFIRRKSLGIPTAIRRIIRGFVVTNMKQSPRWLYEKVYCNAATWKIAFKELALRHGNWTHSCTSFWANQFRVLMTARGLRTDAGNCAYVWLARSARGHKFQFCVKRFLKLGVQVVATVRRVVLHLPQAFPIAIAFIVSL